IVSALDAVDERVRGLRSGGDDYLVKPYAFAELLARLDIMVNRRGAPSEETTIQVADLELNLLTREVKRGTTKIELQPREFLLLEYLMRHTGQVVTRTMLLESVWDYHFDPQTNVIDVHISRLRSKVDKDFEKPLIQTIRVQSSRSPQFIENEHDPVWRYRADIGTRILDRRRKSTQRDRRNYQS
ncbi:MAG: winged helix-turn-helix domain-containing protein, partial [Deltaproteobacteria bacterium]|nr:winged helix-turn-helix domain-containing protein [Deltaproteobacteria bacterium]